MKKVNRQPSKKELKNFGLVILVGFGLIGGLLFRHDKETAAKIIWSLSSGTALAAFLLPRAARYLYIGWMTLGLAMGYVMSRIVMSLIFFGILTPVGLFFRLKGRDALKLKKSETASYWEEHPQIENKEYYDHLF